MKILKCLNGWNIIRFNYKIIFTKIDKLSNNEKFRQLKEIRTRLVFENEDVFFHSSHTNKGREDFKLYRRKI